MSKNFPRRNLAAGPLRIGPWPRRCYVRGPEPSEQGLGQELRRPSANTFVCIECWLCPPHAAAGWPSGDAMREEVLCPWSLRTTAVILVKAHVQHVMQAVLDGPSAPARSGPPSARHGWHRSAGNNASAPSVPCHAPGGGTGPPPPAARAGQSLAQLARCSTSLVHQMSRVSMRPCPPQVS